MMHRSLELIKLKYEKYLQVLSYYEFEDMEIFIGLIELKKEYRNQGYGTMILNEICDYADETNKIITLTPLYKENNEDSSLFNLEDFYIKKFEFIKNEGINENICIKESLYRKPNKNKKKNK